MSDWSFHRHFILWSKGHYPTLGTDSVEAMLIIMSRISWTPFRFVSRADAVEFIVDIALTHGKIDRQQLVNALSQQGALGFHKGTADVVDVLASSVRLREIADLPPLGVADLLTTTKPCD
jgi:hypothetical protein